MTIEVDSVEKRVLAQALSEYAHILKLNLDDEDDDIRKDAAEDLQILQVLEARVTGTKLPKLSDETMELQTRLARGIITNIKIEERLRAILDAPVRNPTLWIEAVKEQGQAWIENEKVMRQARKDTPYRASRQLSEALTGDHLLEFYLTKTEQDEGVGLMWAAMGTYGPGTPEYTAACEEQGRRMARHTAISLKMGELRRGEEPTNWYEPTS